MATSMQAPPGNQQLYLKRREVAAALGVSEDTITGYVKRGVLPQPIKLSSRRHVWPAADIHAAVLRLRQQLA